MTKKGEDEMNKETAALQRGKSHFVLTYFDSYAILMVEYDI